MNHEQLVGRIEQRWHAFVDAYAGLNAAELLEPGVVERWSVKDLMLHVATWEEEALRALPIIMDDRRPPRYGGVDGFNARQSEAYAGHTLEQARESMQSSHRRLLSFLDTVPESWFRTETRFRHRLRLDTWGHYAEHTKAILTWRESKGL